MKLENEETKTVRNFIIILIIVVAIAVGIYYFTNLVVKKDTEKSTEDTKVTNYINPTAAIVGTMLNKDAKEYYVLLLKLEDKDTIEYETLLVDYTRGEKSLPVYDVDLKNPMNSKYYTENVEEINPTAENIEDLRFNDVTLLKVKNKKIVKAYTTKEDIKKEWKLN